MSHPDNELFFTKLNLTNVSVQGPPTVPLAEFEALQRRVRELERRVHLGDWAPPEETEIRMDGYRIIATDVPGETL